MGLLREQMLEEPAPNRAEQFYGVVVGEVRDNNEMHDVPPKVPIGRVRVAFPGLSDKFSSAWAPCARPMGGAGMGFYALPEPGEQVLVAFEHGDLSKPYVLGSLWTVKQRPPTNNLDGLNSKRVIRSRAGHTITFDDTLDVGALKIEDRFGSKITLDSTDGSLTIAAAGNLELRANGTVTISAMGGVTKISMDETQVNVT
jgi:uncharacterized protein involved in type VI secretion and phage assembly